MLPHKRKSRVLRAGRRRRIWTLVLVCLCLGGQYSGFAHLLTVEHGLCPEHGEVVHNPSKRSTSSAPTLPLEAPALKPSPAGAADHDHDHSHDHCLLLSQRRGQDIPRLVARLSPLLPSEFNLPLISDEPSILHSIALLRLAPKNSPPA
jgi:hypothetical protein